jgi:hypothetical protein
VIRWEFDDSFPEECCTRALPSIVKVMIVVVKGLVYHRSKHTNQGKEQIFLTSNLDAILVNNIRFAVSVNTDNTIKAG